MMELDSGVAAATLGCYGRETRVLRLRHSGATAATLGCYGRDTRVLKHSDSYGFQGYPVPYMTIFRIQQVRRAVNFLKPPKAYSEPAISAYFCDFCVTNKSPQAKCLLVFLSRRNRRNTQKAALRFLRRVHVPQSSCQPGVLTTLVASVTKAKTALRSY